MRKWLAVAGMVALGVSACNTPQALTEQKLQDRKTFTMSDLVPVSQPASRQEKEKQQKFRKESVKRFTSLKTAATYYIAEAKRNFNEHKTDSAAYHFGRAWLLDSTNQEVYWGLGMVYGQQQQFDKALYILYKTLEKDKQNPRLLTDIATTHLARFYEASNPEDLVQSRKLLETAIKASPDFADAYYKLAISSYYLQEYGNAWKYLHQSMAMDKAIADQDFVAALLQKQPDPQGVYRQ